MRAALRNARPLAALPLALAGLLAAAPALAQQPAPASDPAAGFLTRPEPGSLRASKLVGVKVIGMDHVRVGEIEDVLLTEDGRVRAVVIGVGGFLGIGQKSVAVPFGALAWNTGRAAAGAPPSHTTPERAPSEAAAASAGPQTMPGATVTDQALAAVPQKRSGTVDDATGSVMAPEPRGRATVLATGDGTVAEAEVRLTKAQLQAAPAFAYEAAR
ncbi:PRC-barrel domain-containing protein [Methylobacterium platani]|uniref:Photosystem reaction center subunit H n=2 Tax=Methylobacterium platani TaxID=427683 RepID=A0A179SH28_9HYPH|nr:PRC-barrel domain-containing protein [Methylobacterium platani]KMO11208.1 photosystem reaction center subunit H [Methylobacterium platani JCM 14648]OAS25777.1 photosystem reaction center subunit H [Methylobacterium platani]